jgi:hemolysin activation/secretion protein
VQNLTKLPSLNNYYFTGYSVSWFWMKVDNIYIPKKGFLFNIKGVTGEKKIPKNPEFPESFYNNVSLKSFKIKLEADLNAYIPLSPRNSIYLRTLSGFQENDQIFENELFLFGGFQSLKGFDEQNFKASEFYMFSSEYRFFLEKLSYLSFFFNYAYYNNSVNQTEDTPFGLGLGSGFVTKAGIFSLYYALGKEKNIPMQIKNGKVHFGFISYF